MKRAKENKSTATTKTAKRSPVGTAIKTFVLLLLAGDLLSLLLNIIGKFASGVMPSLTNAATIIAIGALAYMTVASIAKQVKGNGSEEKKRPPLGAILKGVLFFAGASALTALIVKVSGKVLVGTFKLALQVLPIAILFIAGYIAVSLFFKCKEDSNRANSCPALSMADWRKREMQRCAIAQSKKVSTAQVSQEVIMLQAQLAPDVNACLSSVPATWSWASNLSAARIYIRYDENPNGFFQGNLTVADDRVTEVCVPLSASQLQRYPNAPLLAAQKAKKVAEKAAAAAKAKAEYDTFHNALTEFFGTRKDGARVSLGSLNPTRKSFTLTGPLGKFSVKEAKATAEVKGERVVSISITLPGGDVRTIKRGKQGSPCAAAPKSNETKPAPSKEHQEFPGSGPAPAAAEPQGVPTPTTPAPAKDMGVSAEEEEEPAFQHAEPVDIHQPSGLDEDALERHVRLYADDAGKTINDVAVTAYNAGQEYCFVDWPEGLLTLEEVEAFARILTADYNFSAYEILESTRQVKLRLGMVNSGADNSLEELVAEMIPDLEASAAQQLFEDGEEWTTINWPPEVDSIKAANEFARFLISKSNFDDFRVDPTGQLRLHMAGEDEL